MLLFIYHVIYFSYGAQVAVEEMNKRQEAGEVPQDEVDALGVDVTAKVSIKMAKIIYQFFFLMKFQVITYILESR